MSSIFSKNGIISGRIDQYCLVCAEQFSNEEETLAHIVDSQHKDNLQSCGYFEKYKEDFIRKTKGLYFCEPCSLTFPTATKVELHIDEPKHIEEKNKRSPWLKRVENDIIAFNKFLITDDAWNGCVEDTCVLCNAEFDDDSASHKATRSHILNLIKSEVLFDNVETAVFRTIDAKSKQCLTCNTIIVNDPTSHFQTTEHKEAYTLYDEHLSSQTKKQNTTLNSKKTNPESKTNDVKANNEKADEKDVNKYVNGDVTKKDASKNVIKEIQKDSSKDLKKDSQKDFKKDGNNEKVKEKKLKQSVNSSKKESAAELDDLYCKNLGAKNYVTGGIGEKWCILCEWLLDESPEMHIRTKHHQNLLKIHKESIIGKDSQNQSDASSDEEQSDLYESVDKYQKNNIHIDLINETAVCKKCTKNIDFNTRAIDEHIEEHKQKTSNKKSKENAPPFVSGINSNGTDKTTLFTKPVLLTAGKKKHRPQSTVTAAVKIEDYAKQHGLSHNRADNSYYCHLCSRRLPTTLCDLEKHVISRIHVENTTKKSSNIVANEVAVKKPLNEVIKIFEFVETQSEGCIIIINDKFWLNAFGFFLIAKNKSETILCLGCHIDLTPENVMAHIAISDIHRDMVEESLMITSLEDEFIREIKLEVYHCGYCNDVVNDWDDVLEHITMESHKKNKSEAEKRLKNHKPDLYRRTKISDIQNLCRQFMNRGRFY